MELAGILAVLTTLAQGFIKHKESKAKAAKDLEFEEYERQMKDIRRRETNRNYTAAKRSAIASAIGASNNTMPNKPIDLPDVPTDYKQQDWMREAGDLTGTVQQLIPYANSAQKGIESYQKSIPQDEPGLGSRQYFNNRYRPGRTNFW